MNNVEFERAMVDALVAIIESRGLKHKPVAEEAWSYKKAAYRTWQDMRNGDSPQKLTLRDAYSMTRTLGITMSALCGLVEGRAIAEAMKQQTKAQLSKKEESENQKSYTCGPTLPSAPGDEEQLGTNTG